MVGIDDEHCLASVPPLLASSASGSSWWETEPRFQHRTSMPLPAHPEKPVSLLSILKNAIGKDLLAMPLPVELHEPLTDLQKMGENCEYTQLLDQAAEKPKQSLERLLLVTAYAIAPYSAAKRTRKAVYPMLGETFEMVIPEKRVRYLAEQVSRAPDIVVAHMEGQRWCLDIDGQWVPKLMLNALDIHLNWDLCVTFDDGDAYGWGTLITTVNNITTYGDMYMTHTGTLHVSNASTAQTASIDFGEPGSRLLNAAATRQSRNVKVAGYISNNGSRMSSPTISGQWDNNLTARMPDGSDWRLWTANEPPDDPSRFMFTSFAMTLNDTPAGMESMLPTTDSRFRPDTRALEHGQNAKATEEKERLDARNAAMQAAAKGSKMSLEEAFPARWFERVSDPPEKGKLGKFGGVRFRYKGGYWEARRAGDFGPSPDLFGSSPPPPAA